METVNNAQELKIAVLKKAVTVGISNNSSLKAELESTQAINAELTKEIESLSTKAESNSAEPFFEIEGQLFGFHFHKAVFLGKAITHTDVLQDPSLQKQLVEAGSGMIKAK